MAGVLVDVSAEDLYPHLTMINLDQVRAQFPALSRPVVYFDGPAGSQVPARVVEAMGRYLLESNANHGGVFATARVSDAWLRPGPRSSPKNSRVAQRIASGIPSARRSPVWLPVSTIMCW